MRPPDYTKAFFWSYKFEELDLQQNRDTIVFQILNHGDYKSTKWLLGAYSYSQIQDCISSSLISAWSPRSLNLWSNIFAAKPRYLNRIERISASS